MKEILLTQGQVALVDDADYETVNAFKWYAEKHFQRFYACRKIKKPDGSSTVLRLHAFLMPGRPGVDHRDGNGLNNQRKNLRPATCRQNGQGFQRKRAGATSQYRGVYWYSKVNKWRAHIRVEGKGINLGNFESEIEAALAYDTAAILYFDYPTPNFPLTDNQT